MWQKRDKRELQNQVNPIKAFSEVTDKEGDEIWNRKGSFEDE